MGAEARTRLENAAAQLRRGRAEADHEWDAALLESLEADCYEALTGGFVKASELYDPTQKRIMTDGGESVCGGGTERCGYCDGTELVYEFHPGRGGAVYRCIECLAIEQGQQQFSMPFDVFLDRDMIEPMEHPDAPDFEPYDPREMSYNVARAWFTVLARLKDDDPIVKRDPDAIGTIADETREFLTNVMGADAHKRPSELSGGEVDDE